MARNEQLIRQHKLLQILERYRFGRTLSEVRDELVEELGLSSLHTRSVRRDVEALQAAGFDVQSVETDRGRVWKLGPRFKGAHKITASATELMALSLGRDLMHPLAGTPFWLGIESFWNKVQETLPAGVWAHYTKYRRILHVMGMPAKSYEKHQGMLKTINRASKSSISDSVRPTQPSERSTLTESCFINPACTLSLTHVRRRMMPIPFAT